MEKAMLKAPEAPDSFQYSSTPILQYPMVLVMAEREGFEPSVPLLTVHTISSRAPSASSDISPKILQANYPAG